MGFKELHLDPEDAVRVASRIHPYWTFPERLGFRRFKVKSVELPLAFYRSIPHDIPHTFNNTSPGPNGILLGWAHCANTAQTAIEVCTGDLMKANFNTIQEVQNYFLVRLSTPFQTCAQVAYEPVFQRIVIIWSVAAPNVADETFMVKCPNAAEVLGFEPGIAYPTTAVADLSTLPFYTGALTTAGFYVVAPFAPQIDGYHYVYLRSNELSQGKRAQSMMTPYGSNASNTIIAKIPLYPRLKHGVIDTVYHENETGDYIEFDGVYLNNLDLFFTAENLRDVRIGNLLWRPAFDKLTPIDIGASRWSVTFKLQD